MTRQLRHQVLGSAEIDKLTKAIEEQARLVNVRFVVDLKKVNCILDVNRDCSDDSTDVDSEQARLALLRQG